MKNTFLLAAILLISVTSTAYSGERPSADSKPLIDIIKTLQAQGYEPITEISMDNGVWEVEAYRNNEERELRVDPLSGKVLSDRKD